MKEQSKITTIKINQAKKYTEEQREQVFSEILNQLVNGKNIAEILKSDNKYPSPTEFFKWLIKYPQFKDLYVHAREVKAHALFDELLIVASGGKGKDSITKVQRDRLKADTIKFYIAKILPKVYGEKIDLTSNGEVINIISLGTGIAPPALEKPSIDTDYIDVTEG